MKTVNHDRLLPGLYLSSIYKPKGLFTKPIYIYDVRLVKPNNPRSHYLMDASKHTLEHLLAEVLKSEFTEDTVSWNPMGCNTGFYWETTYKPEYALGILIIAMRKALNYTDVPFSTKLECGNAHSHSLYGAKMYIRDYIEVLYIQKKSRAQCKLNGVIDYKELN